ncbi:hypothetical protein TREMEDRAFT_62352 [Tremella mesenterica DSM 1558]|uniref:uncharacterized protein n=1 Tax=Tremella mesenterica (strain ATCC 24925 / CBS 8224 / DSM 1558 / NBRC 9311 / NRRL Y-6157 / RJB 2259-6 / UBC 559-6) TaxID=578456 RepID=UPI0003F49C90|nr:uncharacterized protein TREMEDRAFT_62352 [Tremella mesenterica DSM 1558]EIW69491.1 hypothetical protein TREMEDRAFT_62352 [Tremella mesenterica DSM 1558]
MFGAAWGQNNQQQAQQNQAGGFGTNNTFGQTTGGFGQTATTFGQPQTQQQNTGFGTTSNTFGGFGTNNAQQTTNAFGARPAFGATGTTFGATNNNNSTPFGATGTSSNTFGTTNNSSLFGKPATNTFGTGTTSNLFGAKPTTTFGATSTPSANQVYQYSAGPFPPPPATGTAQPQYHPTWHQDISSLGVKDSPPFLFHSITAMEPFKGASWEELRAVDYQQGRKDAGAQPPAAGFGTSTAGFGQPAASTSTFGQLAATTNTFGAPKPAFGATTNTGFGATTGGFGNNTTAPFGSTSTTQPTTFGQSTTTGTGFGQTQPQTTGGFGTSNLFGSTNTQQNQNPVFSGFGQAKPAFGATTTTFGAQPAATTTTTFGQPANTTQPFGTFGQTQPQQPPQTQPSLFGNTTGFGANNPSNTFGAQNTQQQTAQPATTAFGSTAAKPAGTFGNTTTPSFNFGTQQNQQQQPATTSLFGGLGQTNTGTTGFGQPQQQQQAQPAQAGNAFGTSGSAFSFGAKPTTTLGSFASTQTAQQPAQTGTTPFGSSLAAPFGSNNTLGQQNQLGGAAKPTLQLFGSGSTFGQPTQQSQQQQSGGSLFSNLNQSQPASTGMLGSTFQQPAQQQPASLFGGMGQSTNLSQSQVLTASIDQNPYGRNDLFAYTGQKLEYGSQTKKPALPPLTASSFRLTPKKSQLRGFASPLTASALLRSSSPLNTLNSPARSSPSLPNRYAGLTEADITPNAFVPRPSIKKLTITPTPKNVADSEDKLESLLGKSMIKSTPLSNSTPARAPPASSPATTIPSPSTSRLTLEKREVPRQVSGSERPPSEGEYWCKPTLAKLKQMSQRDLSSILKFSAGRRGYGEVTFLEPVDLTGLPLDDFLGTVIKFRDMELAVYPDNYADKPPRGKGLNVPAQISLENCFPKDKATKQPIIDPEDPRHARFLKRVKNIPDTEFVSYTDDGVWSFRVEHFSRYGLLDDSDEDSDEAPTKPPPKLRIPEKQPLRVEDDDDFLPTTSLRYNNDEKAEHDSGIDEDDEEYDMSSEEGSDITSRSESNSADKTFREDMDYEDVKDEREHPIKSQLGHEGMRKLREMQNSFFGGQEKKQFIAKRGSTIERNEKVAAERVKRILKESGFGDAEENQAVDKRAVKRTSFGEPQSPPRLRVPRKYARVPLEQCTVGGSEGIRADGGLALGRSFRCSWGPNGELVHLGKICSPRAQLSVDIPHWLPADSGSANSSSSTVIIEHPDLLAFPSEVEISKAIRLLSLHLERSSIHSEDDSEVPAITIHPDIRFRDFASLFDSSDSSHEATVFRLGVALFDEIDLLLPADSSSELAERILEIRRKLALSKWLESAVAPSVDTDLVSSTDTPGKIFTLLSGNQVARAVQTALDGKDMRLATLISQAGGDETFKEEILKQLEDWRKYKSTAFIGNGYRKLYALLGGITDVTHGHQDTSRGSDGAKDVLISQGLDWKRAFGIRLWFSSPCFDSISSVLSSYLDSFSRGYSPAKPLPMYMEKPDEEKRWNMPTEPSDILFGLIRLYSDQTLSLESVLRSRDASSSPVDVRLTWHLYMLLSQVLRKRDLEDREEGYSAKADGMTKGYAAQLEESGEWKWAAFVLLHLETIEGREAALRALLHRHPFATPSEIQHLTETLLIPVEWIHEASAASFASSDDAWGEYHALIKAGLLDRAQRILISKLAGEAVLRGDLQLLRRLCEPLEERQPSGWEFGGKLFIDYADIVEQVPKLLEEVLRHPHKTQERVRLSVISQNVPRVIQLLPALFPDKEDTQQMAVISDMLSELHQIAGGLSMAGYMDRPAVSNVSLVDVDRLHLLQAKAYDVFEKSLNAVAAK